MTSDEVNELVGRMRTIEPGPDFHPAPGVSKWLVANWAMREEAATAIEALICERDELEALVRRLEYSDGDAEHWRRLAKVANERIEALQTALNSAQEQAMTDLNQSALAAAKTKIWNYESAEIEDIAEAAIRAYLAAAMPKAVAAWKHKPTGNVLSDEDYRRVEPEWSAKFYNIKADFEPLYALSTDASSGDGSSLQKVQETPDLGEWQDIASAPKDGTYFLAFPVLLGVACVVTWERPVSTPPMMRAKGENIDHNGFWRMPMSMTRTPYEPTHWMPLPAAPSPKQEG